MINTNLQTTTFKPYNKGIQTSRLDNVTFKSSSFAARRPENFDLSVDEKDSSTTPIYNYLSGIFTSFLGSKNNSANKSNAIKNISYLA